jgi:hypothetical protein
MSSLQSTSRRLAHRRVSTAVGVSVAPSVQAGAVIARRVNPLPALLALAGAIVPTEVQIHIAGARLSPGRAAAVLLFYQLCSFCSERAVESYCVTFLLLRLRVGCRCSRMDCILAAAGGETLDFLGGYLIARAFFSNPTSIDEFIRVLRCS